MSADKYIAMARGERRGAKGKGDEAKGKRRKARG
jgi:hypothetical protein